MERKIIKKYKDKYSFISNIKELSYELFHNKIDDERILNILNYIEKTNEKIINDLKSENKEKEDTIKEISNYILKENNYIPKVSEIELEKVKEKDVINIDFYINLIDENKDNIYIFLPKNNDKESINIIDLIIIKYLKDYNFYRDYYKVCESQKEKVEVSTFLSIIKEKISLIKKYKEEILLETKEELENHKNNVSFYVDSKNIPYVFSDIDINFQNIEVMCNLIDSIFNGTFKNIKPFTNNEVLKGIYEVRDLSNRTRVFFTIESNEYCVFYAINDKSETNSIYKKKLENRYKIYKDSKKQSKIIKDYKLLIKELKGETYGKIN